MCLLQRQSPAAFGHDRKWLVRIIVAHPSANIDGDDYLFIYCKFYTWPLTEVASFLWISSLVVNKGILLGVTIQKLFVNGVPKLTTSLRRPMVKRLCYAKSKLHVWTLRNYSLSVRGVSDQYLNMLPPPPMSSWPELEHWEASLILGAYYKSYDDSLATLWLETLIDTCVNISDFACKVRASDRLLSWFNPPLFKSILQLRRQYVAQSFGSTSEPLNQVLSRSHSCPIFYFITSVSYHYFVQ